MITVTADQVTGPAVGRAGQPGTGRRKRRLARLIRLAPLSPALVLMAVFLLGPILYCLYYAFTDLQLSGSASTHFVGFANFARAFGDPEFFNALWLTVVFTVISAVIGQNLLGLALALLMRRASTVVSRITGAVVVAAWVLPSIVAAYLMYAFFRDVGSLNAILGFLHLPAQDWLYTLPIFAVSVANIWRGTAFAMLVYSAALAAIPPEIEESATVDGAGGLRRLWHITLPTIRNSITTTLMLLTLQTLAVFGLILTMTNGGPGDKSTTLPIYMYQQAFTNSEIGYGTAMALMLLLVGAVFAVVYVRALRTEI